MRSWPCRGSRRTFRSSRPSSQPSGPPGPNLSPNRPACAYSERNREGWPVQVGVGRERRTGERRVAATPETVQQLTALGLHLLVEGGAGTEAGFEDAAFKAAGGTMIAELPVEALDVLLHVRPLSPETAARL